MAWSIAYSDKKQNKRYMDGMAKRRNTRLECLSFGGQNEEIGGMEWQREDILV
jgi:hypothetical protein